VWFASMGLRYLKIFVLTNMGSNYFEGSIMKGTHANYINCRRFRTCSKIGCIEHSYKTSISVEKLPLPLSRAINKSQNLHEGHC